MVLFVWAIRTESEFARSREGFDMVNVALLRSVAWLLRSEASREFYSVFSDGRTNSSIEIGIILCSFCLGLKDISRVTFQLKIILPNPETTVTITGDNLGRVNSLAVRWLRW
jgi:hypothetical protein